MLEPDILEDEPPDKLALPVRVSGQDEVRRVEFLEATPDFLEDVKGFLDGLIPLCRGNRELRELPFPGIFLVIILRHHEGQKMTRRRNDTIPAVIAPVSRLVEGIPVARVTAQPCGNILRNRRFLSKYEHRDSITNPKKK